MPLYDIKCPKCGIIEDVWAKIDNLNPACPKCGHATNKLISPVRIQCDISPYFDENLADSKKNPHGQWITSRQHKKQILKEKGLVEIG